MLRSVPTAAEGTAGDRTEGQIEVATLFEGRTRIAGIGWRLTSSRIPGPVHAVTRRHGVTRLASELEAIRRGLAEAAREGCRAIVVRVPDPRAVVLIRGDRPSRFRRAEAPAARVRTLLRQFSSVRFETRFAPDPELTHAVGEALDSGLHAAAEREEDRILAMERIIERAKHVRLELTDTGWVANGRYHVQLDPMRCECPAWTTRWARAPIAGRKAQRLPCKHIVALALHEGFSVPADLVQMARRAPP